MHQKITQFVIFTIICLLAGNLHAQPFNDYILSNRLQDLVNNTHQEKYEVILLLKDQVDIEGMDRMFYRHGASISERTIQVITALKEKAATTQRPLLNYLSNKDINQVNTYWITNLLAFSASKEVLAELSNHPDVGWIDFDAPLALESYREEAMTPPPPPGIGQPERGLIAIGADKLWAMGYTGYGRLAMSADTGIDPFHPAIINNWRGNFSSADASWFDANNSANNTPSNCGDHGVHTLGTMVGLDRTNNDTIGVAFNAQWVGSNVLCGSGTSGNIAAFQWAMDPDEDPNTVEDMPDAINNSWWDPGASGECQGAYIGILNALEAVGIAVIFSAGNEGPDASTITAPKNINTNIVNSFTVAAVNGNNASLTVSGFSSRGPSICGGDSSLLIKPEVSAPGQNVRSCELDGTYGSKSGTSMAAPHVAGAVVLLKEAFPELTGTQIKTALYFSCRDLGATGEDNTYGMGIINVLDAYNYLIAEGHTPVPPGVENDIMYVDVVAETRNCNGLLTFDMVFENAGTNDLTSADLTYQLIDLSGNEALNVLVPWTGNLAPGQRENISIAITDAPEGAYDLIFSVANPNGQQDGRDYISSGSRTVLISNEAPVSFDYKFDVPPCENSSVTVEIDIENAVEILWYLSETSGNPIFSGKNLQMPPAVGQFTLYVETTVNTQVGEPEPAAGSITENGVATNRGFIFDAHSDFILKSVSIHVEDTSTRLLSLRRNGNVVHQQIINNLTLGENIIPVDLEIMSGSDYRLTLTGTPVAQQSETNYPYFVSNVMTIKSSTDFAAPTENYYFFYDIQIEHPQVCGRIPVVVEYQPTDLVPSAGFIPSENPVNLNNNTGMVSFSNNSQNGETYFWDFGDGNTSTESDPTHVYTSAGTYEVSLLTVNAEGCGDSESIDLEVREDLSPTDNETLESSISIYPNPMSNVSNLNIRSSEYSEVEIAVLDVFGNIIKSEKQRISQELSYEIRLDNHPAGLYFVRCRFDDRELLQKIVKLN